MKGFTACDLGRRTIDRKASTEALRYQNQTSVELRRRYLERKFQTSVEQRQRIWESHPRNTQQPATPGTVKGGGQFAALWNPNLGRTTIVVLPADGTDPRNSVIAFIASIY
jgi:hypothetical protein